MSQPPQWHSPYGPPPPPVYPTPVPRQPGITTGGIIAICVGVAVLACFGLAAIGGIIDANEPQAQRTAPVEHAAGDNSTAAPTMIVMPDVVGKNAAAAGDELEKLGFTRVEYGSVDVGETVVLPSNWWVAEQSQPAGQIVSSDTLIVLGCTKKRP